MSTYEVLARKYRPQQFEEIVGQDHIVRTLKNAISQKRMAHAYLFVGARGTGKTTISRIFAKAFNCSAFQEPSIKPCDACSNCKEIMAGTSMDVLEIDGASNNGVDQIRELRETVRYAPTKSRYKIIYIDEVHMVTTAAFNALLKTLEEPPPHVKFLFATTDPQKIPLTILSRCQRFDFHRISTALIIQHLRKIAQLEKVIISDTALLAIARGAGGGMRDAESALDQMIAFCGNNIKEEDVLSIFGLVANEQVRCLTRGILVGERAEVITLASTLSEEGKDLGKLLGELIEHFRNVLVIQTGAKPTENTPEELTELKEQSKIIHRARALRILEILTEAENQIRWTLSKRILFEVTLIRAIETKDEVLLEEVLKKLKDIAPSTNISRIASDKLEKKNQKVPPTSEANPLSAPQKHASLDPISLEELWKSLMEHLAKPMPMLKANMMEGCPLSINADTFLIGFDPEFELQKEFVDTSKSRELIQAALREIIHKPMNIKVVFANDPSIPCGDEPPISSSPATPSAHTKEGSANDHFENDPLIQKALKIFKGQIIEIRQ